MQTHEYQKYRTYMDYLNAMQYDKNYAKLVAQIKGISNHPNGKVSSRVLTVRLYGRTRIFTYLDLISGDEALDRKKREDSRASKCSSNT
ncbi:hypothetical protein GQ600_15874 [Phytophthora cactorum]|nr:hypothetical protein GQ600_15874 [Phytophthora cactorum]